MRVMDNEAVIVATRLHQGRLGGLNAKVAASVRLSSHVFQAVIYSQQDAGGRCSVALCVRWQAPPASRKSTRSTTHPAQTRSARGSAIKHVDGRCECSPQPRGRGERTATGPLERSALCACLSIFGPKDLAAEK